MIYIVRISFNHYFIWMCDHVMIYCSVRAILLGLLVWSLRGEDPQKYQNRGKMSPNKKRFGLVLLLFAGLTDTWRSAIDSFLKKNLIRQKGEKKN